MADPTAAVPAVTVLRPVVLEGELVRLRPFVEGDAETMQDIVEVHFPGIKPRSTFTYEFPIRQAGTYWYHSHSGLQEQLGHYGPIVIDPAGADP